MIRVKNRIAWGITIGLLLLAIAALATVVQGGPLDPPAAPAALGPTMITALPFTANGAAPGGSYVLAGDLTCSTCTSGQNGITIAADGVSIDLNGFTITGVAGSGRGIDTAGFVSVTIRNGTIRNWGTDGIGNSSVSVSQLGRFESLRVLNNGLGGSGVGAGIVAGDTAIVTGCVCTFNGRDGIQTKANGIVKDNEVGGNGWNGIEVGARSLVTGNNVNQNVFNASGSGTAGILSTAPLGQVRVTSNNVTSQANAGHGIQLSGQAESITDNTSQGNGGDGIHLGSSFNSVISGNQTMGNTVIGINVGAGPACGVFCGTVITGNTSSYNGTANYVVGANNDEVAPTSAIGATSPLANVSD